MTLDNLGSREPGEIDDADFVGVGAIRIGYSFSLVTIRLGVFSAVVGYTLMSQTAGAHYRESTSIQQTALDVPIFSDHGYRSQIFHWTKSSGGATH